MKKSKQPHIVEPVIVMEAQEREAPERDLEFEKDVKLGRLMFCGSVPMRYSPASYFQLSEAEEAHAASIVSFTGETGKVYTKNSDGVFLIDPRDLVAALRHGFIKA